MYRVTTPTFTYVLPIQTSTCDVVQVTFRQGDTDLIKTYENETLPSGMTFDGKNVVVQLTQEETKAFKADDMIETQIRVLTNTDAAYASKVFKLTVNDVLNEEILNG